MILVSCSDRNQSNDELVTNDGSASKEFTFFYDMNEDFSSFKLMNTNSIITDENGHKYSRLNENHEFGIGVQFSAALVNGDVSLPQVSLKVNKSVLNSEFNLVFSCDYKDESKEDLWKGILIDSTRIDTSNTWREILIKDEFILPSDTPDDAVISIYTWSVDKAQVDVDDFGLKW